MEKSTVIAGISLLAVAGMGTYIYLKGKKSTTTNSTVTTPTPPTNDIKALADLGVKIEEPKVTPYVAPSVPVPTVSLENIQKALLALGIDQTRGITELSSPNYIEAKRIAGNMKEIDLMMKTKLTGGKNPMGGIDKNLVSKLSEQSISTYGNGAFNPSVPQLLANMTKKVNSLGYKVLANFDIEKM